MALMMAWWHDTGTPGATHGHTSTRVTRRYHLCWIKQPGMAHYSDIVTLSALCDCQVPGDSWHTSWAPGTIRGMSPLQRSGAGYQHEDHSLTFLGHWGPRELLTLRGNDILAVLIIPFWWPLTAPDRGHCITRLWSSHMIICPAI